MVVDKRTVLNENRERVRVRWTAKRGNEIDLIGQMNMASILGHSQGQQVGTVVEVFYRVSHEKEPAFDQQ